MAIEVFTPRGWDGLTELPRPGCAVGPPRPSDAGRAADGLVADLERELSRGRDCVRHWRSAELNVGASVRITQTQPASGPLPARRGFVSHLSLSGYAPEAIFEHRLCPKITAKAGRRQAVAVDWRRRLS
jgi:hypothetical protein